MSSSNITIWFKTGVLSLFLGACILTPALAEETRVLTWEDALQEARVNNPDLVSAKEKINQSKAQKNAVKSGTLPQINSSLNAGTTKASGRDRSESYSFSVNAQQLLFDGFKTANDIGAASKNLDASHYNYEVTSSDVRLNLRVAFIDLLNAQEALRVAKDIASRRKQSVDMIELQYQGGREHRGSLLTAQANLEEASYDIQAATRDVSLSQRRLMKAMGWKNFVPVVAQGSLEQGNISRDEPTFEDLINEVPLLKALVARKEAAKYDVASAKSSFFPAIYANAGAGKSDNNWPPNQSSLTAGISVSLPIFQGGQQQAQLSNARAVYAQLQADERSGKDSVLFTLAQTWTYWQNGIDSINVQQKFLAAAEERAKIAEVQYSSGLITFNDWIIIEDNLVNAQKGIVTSQSNALIAFANWEQAKGVTLDE